MFRLFAAACLVGGTLAQQKLPTESRCQQVCPSCTTNPPWTTPCNCGDSCWPGHNVSDTPDRTCACFAKLGFCKDGEVPKWDEGAECPQCWPKENTACACFAAIGFCDPPERLPTVSQCTSHIDGWNQSPLCPGCDSIDCKCDACWPGRNVSHTPDHTCECFAELSFCKEGTQPVYTPGAKCPSCWPKDNTACDCFAAVGFCDAPAPEEMTWQCKRAPFRDNEICTEMPVTDCQRDFPNTGCAVTSETQCKTDNHECLPVTFSCYEDKKDYKWGCKGAVFQGNKTVCQLVDDAFTGVTYSSLTECEGGKENTCEKGGSAPPLLSPTRCVKQAGGQPINLPDATSFRTVGVNHSSMSDCEQQLRAGKCADHVPAPPKNGDDDGAGSDDGGNGDTTMKILLGVAGLGFCAVIGVLALAKRGALPCGQPGAKPDPRSDIDAPILSEHEGDLGDSQGVSW